MVMHQSRLPSGGIVYEEVRNYEEIQIDNFWRTIEQAIYYKNLSIFDKYIRNFHNLVNSREDLLEIFKTLDWKKLNLDDPTRSKFEEVIEKYYPDILLFTSSW